MNNTYIIREAVPDDAEKMLLYLNKVNGESGHNPTIMVSAGAFL